MSSRPLRSNSTRVPEYSLFKFDVDNKTMPFRSSMFHEPKIGGNFEIVYERKKHSGSILMMAGKHFLILKSF